MRTENDENLDPQLKSPTPRMRQYKFMPDYTAYGRPIKAPVEQYPYSYPSPFKRPRPGGGFFMGVYFVEDVVMPVFPIDELGLEETLKETVSEKHMTTPSKTTVSVTETGTPVRVTQTPRRRVFKPMSSLRVENGGAVTEIQLLQNVETNKAHQQRRMKTRPPVVHRSREQVRSTLKAPSSPHKRAKRIITKDDLRAKKRKRTNTKKQFSGNSANEIQRSSSDEELTATYDFCHIDQFAAGGSDERRDKVVAPTGSNGWDIVGERSSSQTIKSPDTDVSSLDYETEVTLKEVNGVPTHVATHSVKLWSSPGGSRSVEMKHKSDAPNYPTRGALKVVDETFKEVFSSSEGETQSSGDEFDVQPRKLSFTNDESSLLENEDFDIEPKILTF